jgi:UDP-N-acetylmuramate--alanine ligase
LHDEFAGAFTDADLVVLTDIYSAGEMPIAGVSGALLRDSITQGSQVEVVYAPQREQAVATVAERLQAGDVLLTLGAGPVWQWGDAAMATYQSRDAGHAAGSLV